MELKCWEAALVWRSITADAAAADGEDWPLDDDGSSRTRDSMSSWDPRRSVSSSPWFSCLIILNF